MDQIQTFMENLEDEQFNAFLRSLRHEGPRIEFLCRRDGIPSAIEFVIRTYPMYRLSLKHGMAKDKVYRITYLRSCADFRKFLRLVDIYSPLLPKIKYA